MKLVEKIYMEQGNTLLISQEEIMRLERIVSHTSIEFILENPK